MSDWVRNLAEGFPHLPDGPVLWAEQVWRQEADRDHAVESIARWLARAGERGLPMTSGAIGYADVLLTRLGAETERLPQ